MYVAVSTDCYPDLLMPEVVEAFVDLEFTTVEIALREDGTPLSPSRIDDNFDKAVHLARRSHRLEVCSYDVHIDAQGEAFYDQFAAICRLGKATKVVTLTVPSGELGTPFNEEVERLQRLVDLATDEGVRVAMKSQIGRLSEDPDTVKVLCDNVKGLGLTFDPSHYHCGPHAAKSLDRIMPYVFHVHLRDSKADQLQVRVGQGEIEYGKFVLMLQRAGYSQALSIQMAPMKEFEQRGELRKLRLLLETLL
ncbi:sugar phosphate isomerase/epimerase family protein [Aureliella helgolandensis]|uniref:Xylose isomerase-like TIM barrel n=1 Tax=Aureliella helgolandensis TaxID=2527968 RepID=A0A518GAM1_9BACT|nr:sugar phosphate isomerase/epimerase [Aureliella helgolandensis]QDV25648.1 Xylose isomerase-like TIM barrel [Aureliella helgolandensis]